MNCGYVCNSTMNFALMPRTTSLLPWGQQFDRVCCSKCACPGTDSASKESVWMSQPLCYTTVCGMTSWIRDYSSDMMTMFHCFRSSLLSVLSRVVNLKPLRDLDMMVEIIGSARQMKVWCCHSFRKW
eukprot:Rmarinus@m.20839